MYFTPASAMFRPLLRVHAKPRLKSPPFALTCAQLPNRKPESVRFGAMMSTVPGVRAPSLDAVQADIVLSLPCGAMKYATPVASVVPLKSVVM